MNFRVQPTALLAGSFLIPAAMHAQLDFHVHGRDFQVHSFGSQGFLYSNQNNYLSMPTGKGSFALTDGGNMSSQLNPVYVTAEGHFFDGAPSSPSAARGFYAIANSCGILPTTNLFVLRTGFTF